MSADFTCAGRDHGIHQLRHRHITFYAILDAESRYGYLQRHYLIISDTGLLLAIYAGIHLFCLCPVDLYICLCPVDGFDDTLNGLCQRKK